MARTMTVSDCRVNPCDLCRKRTDYVANGKCYDCAHGFCEDHKAKKGRVKK